jgi:hypothetical protein
MIVAFNGLKLETGNLKLGGEIGRLKLNLPAMAV